MVSAIAHFVAEPPTSSELARIASAIANDVCAPNASAVDRDARFPHEAIAALRAHRMLSVLVPSRFGGAQAQISDVALAVESLGKQCASTAMVYAMHHIQIAAVARHGHNDWAHDFLARVARDELLLASATTELGVGGDVRSSICSVEYDGDNFSLEKNSPVVSYGIHSDAILATARRTAESPAGDQVLVVIPTVATTLEHKSPWNAMGFRGTCSDGYIVRGAGSVEQILTDPYDDISARTMLPTSHVLWASVWLGLATSAVDIARTYVRAAARKSPGTTPPGAIHLAALVGKLEEFRSLTRERTAEYEAAMHDPDRCGSMGFAIRMNTLKVSSSNLVVECVTSALRICGISGYLEDSPYSLSRHLRDAHGAALMVSNDRLTAASAQMLLVHKET